VSPGDAIPPRFPAPRNRRRVITFRAGPVARRVR